MSCNGCRVLRKGCSDTCILRPCLQWIESADAQGHATVFVAKFFGRAGLMGFISAVHETERPALFQSLLYEACGRTVNPVFGAVGLLSGGNWQACQTAVETVLKGGTLRPPSTSLSSSCLPANLSSNAFPKLTTPLPVRGDDDAQGANTPPSRSVTEPVPERQNNGLGIASSLPRSRDLEKYVDGGLNSAMKGWHEESVRRQNVDQMLSWPSGIKHSSDIKNQPLTHTPEDMYERSMFKPKELGFLDLYGTHAVCPSPRRVKARVDFSLVNPSGLQEAASEHLITTPRADKLELDLTLTVKGDKAGQIVGSKRVSSPSESVNSEGSVTTLDSTPREYSRMTAWTTKMDLVTPPFSKLLPLLQ